MVAERRPAARAAPARPLIPQRVVALVFVSAVHDATIRAVNYARSLGAGETRAVYFDLDPDIGGLSKDAYTRQLHAVALKRALAKVGK